jgi:hypothetical protein
MTTNAPPWSIQQDGNVSGGSKNSRNRMDASQISATDRLVIPAIANAAHDYPMQANQLARDRATNRLVYSKRNDSNSGFMWHTVEVADSNPDLSGTYHMANVTVSDTGKITAATRGGPVHSPPDNTLARFDASAAPQVRVQGSGVTVSDAGLLSGVSGLSNDSAPIVLSAPRIIATNDVEIHGTVQFNSVANVQSEDQFVHLSAGYSRQVARNGGLVVVRLPTMTHCSVGAGGFTAGVAAASNPHVDTVESSVFVAGDIVQVIDAHPEANNSLYEVLEHTGTTLRIRGMGTNRTTVGFVSNQFTTDATAATGTIRRVGVAVLSFHAATGNWHTATLENTSALPAQWRTLIYSVTAAPDSGISVTDDGSGAVVIANTDRGSSVTLNDAGTSLSHSLINDSTGPSLGIKGLQGGAGISVSDTATDVTVALAPAGTSGQLLTSNGPSAAPTFQDYSISSVGDGASLVKSTTMPLSLKSVTAGTGITLTQNANDVQIAANTVDVSGSVTGGVGIRVIPSGPNVSVALDAPVSMANGGTGARLTPVRGGVLYADSAQIAITGAGTSGQILTSNGAGAGAPTWQTPITSNYVVAADDGGTTNLQTTTTSAATPITTLKVTIPAPGTYVVRCDLVMHDGNVVLSGWTVALRLNNAKINGTGRQCALPAVDSSVSTDAIVNVVHAGDTIDVTMQRGGSGNVSYRGGTLMAKRIA